ncbi:MAG: hypothetical protein QOI35_2831 [Cryptosporangiaceae bacterium]|nr:hypothetical protein [Cryptosporangiaceae bacterium]
MRRIVLVVVAGGLIGIVAALVPASSPADAHGDTIDFGLTAGPDGRVTATATWANDHHAVSEPVAGTLLATAASGQRIGPVPLVPVQGKVGVLTIAQPLPKGTWTAVAESAVPAIGRGEAVLNVGVPGAAPAASATPAPESTPAPEAATTPSAAAVAEPRSGEPGLWAGSLIAAAVIAGLGVLVVRSRRQA